MPKQAAFYLPDLVNKTVHVRGNSGDLFYVRLYVLILVSTGAFVLVLAHFYILT